MSNSVRVDAGSRVASQKTATQILSKVVAGKVPAEGATATFNGVEFKMEREILRSVGAMAVDRDALSDFYHKHWTLSGAYDDQASDAYQAQIFTVMFGKFFTDVSSYISRNSAVLDVGCGSGVAGRVFFGPLFPDVDYIGVDMSRSVDQAWKEFSEKRLAAAFIQAEISTLPIRIEAVDVVFCPGVLHYTESIATSVNQLGRHLKRGGHFITWVYKRQKPIRVFTDQLLRRHFSGMSPEDAFEVMKPLTELGIALGRSNVKITIPTDIPVLEIEKGEYDLQRFFYYHILKLFYHPDLTFTRHNVNNWNAYYPAAVLFPTEDELRSELKSAGFAIEHFNPHGNGIAVVARREG